MRGDGEGKRVSEKEKSEGEVRSARAERGDRDRERRNGERVRGKGWRRKEKWIGREKSIHTGSNEAWGGDLKEEESRVENGRYTRQGKE